MRRQESRRGTKVTGEADPEGIEPRKLQTKSADGIDSPAGYNPRSAKASCAGTPRGPRPCRGLDKRLAELSARLRRLGYRPKPARRAYIPKGDGRYRPLGIPSFEDRLVQERLSRILQAIWEPEFCACSYGFRPGRSAHDALRRVAEVITHQGTQWVVEADIKGFFNHVSHAHLERFLAHRISDGNLLRIIRRFLKAGILEDSVFTASEEGTPQGGLVSPVLSNIYLHYVLDLWFEKRFARSCEGRAHLIRYADNYVACFQRETDARRFLTGMTERLVQFDLEVEPSKTALLQFGRQARGHKARDAHDLVKHKLRPERGLRNQLTLRSIRANQEF